MKIQLLNLCGLVDMSDHISEFFKDFLNAINSTKKSDLRNSTDYKFRKRMADTLIEEYCFDQMLAMKISYCVNVKFDESIALSYEVQLMEMATSMAKAFVMLLDVAQEDLGGENPDFFIMQKIAENFSMSLKE